MTLSELIKDYPPISGLGEKSFARFTIQNRLPHIIDGILSDHPYPSNIESEFRELKERIIHGKLSEYISTGTDKNQWKEWLESYRNMDWFEAPFYFIEAYFYRLILDKTGYFSNAIDPFEKQKKKDIMGNTGHFMHMLSDLKRVQGNTFESKISINHLLNLCLWGNKSDLSQLTMNTKGVSQFTDNPTFIDDSESISDYLNKGASRVDLILDNSGVELFTDLMLVVHLLESQKVECVHLHAKACPTFVSDATTMDIDNLLYILATTTDLQLNEFAHTANDLNAKRTLNISSHFFWNSPLHFYQMPDDLKHDLSKSDLIIFKGDANYRRIFGDRQIPYDQKLESITDYLPAKSIAIRILKSEIMLGLEKEAISKLYQADNDWLVNGRYGMIQLLN